MNCPVGYCLSGGVCRMNGNVPYCECPALYTGQQCEIFIGATTTTLAPGRWIIHMQGSFLKILFACAS